MFGVPELQELSTERRWLPAADYRREQNTDYLRLKKLLKFSSPFWCAVVEQRSSSDTGPEGCNLGFAVDIKFTTQGIAATLGQGRVVVLRFTVARQNSSDINQSVEHSPSRNEFVSRLSDNEACHRVTNEHRRLGRRLQLSHNTVGVQLQLHIRTRCCVDPMTGEVKHLDTVPE